MATHPTLRDFVSEDVADGVEELCAELEKNGWYPRARWASSGVRYWPDNERGKNIVVELNYPINEHKLDFLRRHTGLALDLMREGENR